MKGETGKTKSEGGVKNKIVTMGDAREAKGRIHGPNSTDELTIVLIQVHSPLICTFINWKSK